MTKEIAKAVSTQGTVLPEVSYMGAPGDINSGLEPFGRQSKHDR